MTLKWHENSENESCLRLYDGNTERKVCVIRCVDGHYFLDGSVNKTVWYNHLINANTMEEAKVEVKRIFANKLTESLQECLNKTKIYSEMLAALA